MVLAPQIRAARKRPLLTADFNDDFKLDHPGARNGPLASSFYVKRRAAASRHPPTVPFACLPAFRAASAGMLRTNVNIWLMVDIGNAGGAMYASPPHPTGMLCQSPRRGLSRRPRFSGNQPARLHTLRPQCY
jgi:hypothetical protein